MAERRVTQAIRDRYGRNLALCNPGESWSPRRCRDAIRDIHFGLHHYIASAEGKEADIHVVNDPSGAYLRTDPDSTTWNNLDDLPQAKEGNALTGVSEVALQ